MSRDLAEAPGRPPVSTTKGVQRCPYRRRFTFSPAFAAEPSVRARLRRVRVQDDIGATMATSIHSCSEPCPTVMSMTPSGMSVRCSSRASESALPSFNHLHRYQETQLCRRTTWPPQVRCLNQHHAAHYVEAWCWFRHAMQGPERLRRQQKPAVPSVRRRPPQRRVAIATFMARLSMTRSASIGLIKKLEDPGPAELRERAALLSLQLLGSSFRFSLLIFARKRDWRRGLPGLDPFSHGVEAGGSPAFTMACPAEWSSDANAVSVAKRSSRKSPSCSATKVDVLDQEAAIAAVALGK